MSLLTDSNAKRHVIVTSSNTAHAVRRPALHTHTHTHALTNTPHTHRRFRIECERDSRRHVSLLAALLLERTRGSRRHDVQEHVHLREKQTTISQQKYFYCQIYLIWTNACSNTDRRYTTNSHRVPSKLHWILHKLLLLSQNMEQRTKKLSASILLSNRSHLN